jgi:hypothetical protein
LRAYANLTDDDHDPRALQKILLADCPFVRVRIVGAFVWDGVTSYVVDRLVSGGQCIVNDDEECIKFILESINQAAMFDTKICVCKPNPISPQVLSWTALFPRSTNSQGW